MASPWIDVSVTLRTGMVSWPGDPPARISHAKEIERGDPCTVSLLEMGAHTGTHMDAPAHFVRGGIGMRVKKIDKEEATRLIFRSKRDAATDALVNDIRQTLGLDPNASDFRVVYGSVPRDDQEIALLTRSILSQPLPAQ